LQLEHPDRRRAKLGLFARPTKLEAWFSRNQQGVQLKFLWDPALRPGQRSGQLMPPLLPSKCCRSGGIG